MQFIEKYFGKSLFSNEQLLQVELQQNSSFSIVDWQSADKSIKTEFKNHLRCLQITNVIKTFSSCKRNQVGAIIYKNGKILSDGYNGTPKGFCNNCEDESNNTHWYVLHAESNAILKLSRTSNDTSEDATLYVTISPCKECSKLIIQSGIKTVVFCDVYRDTTGIEFLLNSNIQLIYIPYNQFNEAQINQFNK